MEIYIRLEGNKCDGKKTRKEEGGEYQWRLLGRPSQRK